MKENAKQESAYLNWVNYKLSLNLNWVNYKNVCFYIVRRGTVMGLFLRIQNLPKNLTLKYDLTMSFIRIINLMWPQSLSSWTETWWLIMDNVTQHSMIKTA